MKALQAASVLLLSLSFTHLAFSFGSCRPQTTCNPCQRPVVYKDCRVFKDCGYRRLAYNRAACPDNVCARYETPCQCSDEGWRYNCCISRCRYCMAFGNVGGR